MGHKPVVQNMKVARADGNKSEWRRGDENSELLN